MVPNPDSRTYLDFIFRLSCLNLDNFFIGSQCDQGLETKFGIFDQTAARVSANFEENFIIHQNEFRWKNFSNVGRNSRASFQVKSYFRCTVRIWILNIWITETFDKQTFSVIQMPCNKQWGSEIPIILIWNTVGARIPNELGIRMVHSCSVLVPTIWKQTLRA